MKVVKSKKLSGLRSFEICNMFSNLYFIQHYWLILVVPLFLSTHAYKYFLWVSLTALSAIILL